MRLAVILKTAAQKGRKEYIMKKFTVKEIVRENDGSEYVKEQYIIEMKNKEMLINELEELKGMAFDRYEIAEN